MSAILSWPQCVKFSLDLWLYTTSWSQGASVIMESPPTPDVLTHWPLHKMAAILADGIFKCIFLNEDDKIFIQISLKLVPRSPIDIKPAPVQVMAWRRTDDKPIPEPMLTQFTDAYMRHSGELNTIWEQQMGQLIIIKPQSSRKLFKC